MNQFVGSNFEGTPINKLMNDNNFGQMPPVSAPYPQNSNFFNQPSRDIKELVNNINDQLDIDYNSIRDNVSFNLTENDEKKKLIKYMNKEEKNKKEESDSSSMLLRLKKKLKKIKEKKREQKERNKEEKRKETTEESVNEPSKKPETEKEADYIAIYNIGKHMTKDTKELLLIIAIYSILSMGFVKKTIGGYITYINPNETGKYSFVGVLIYGFLLALLFIVFRKLLLN